MIQLPETLLQAITDLEKALVNDDSDIRLNLITIHKALAKNPAIVTILSNEERATIFKGYKRQAGIELVKKGSKERGKKTVDYGSFDIQL